MRIEVFQREVNRIMESIQKPEQMILLSKVIGNNHRQSFLNQLMIYDKYPSATACATYDYWLDKYNRVAIPGSRGIPAMFSVGKALQVRHIFDYTQTKVAEGRQKIQEFRRWSVPEEQKEFRKNEVLLSLEKSLVSFSKKDFSKLEIEIIRICGRIALLERLGMSSIEETQLMTAMLENNSFQWNSESGKLFSSIIQNLLVQVEESLIRRDSYERGIEQGISGGLEQNGRRNARERREGLGRDGRDRSAVHGDDEFHFRRLRDTGGYIEQDRGSDVGRVIRGRGVPERISDAGIRKDATVLLGEQSGGETLRNGATKIPGQNLGSVPERSSTPGSRDVGEGETGLDGALGLDRGDEKIRAGEIRGSSEKSGVGIRRGDYQEDRRGIESEQGQLSFIDTISEEAKGSNKPFAFPLEDFQVVLQRGGNQSDLRMKILSKYSKAVSDEEMVAYLKEQFRGGNGFVQSGRKFSAWYTENGIEVTYGTRENQKDIFSWTEAAQNIRKMIQSGTYATKVETNEALEHERRLLAERLWYLKRDFSDVANEEGFLATIQDIRGNNFPDEVEKITERLYSVENVKSLQREYENFLSEYTKDPSILRFRAHPFEQLKQGLNELLLPRLPITSYVNQFSVIHSFITEKELEKKLFFGSPFVASKFRIYTFFKEKHSFQEQIDFLKKEYGTGGYSSKDEVCEMHDGKGITYTKEHCPPVFLPWSQVSIRIQQLIRKGRYFTEDERKKYEEWMQRESVENTKKENRKGENAPISPTTMEITEELLSVSLEREDEKGKATEKDDVIPSLASNYRIESEQTPLPPSERLKNNITAIRILQEIENTHRTVTPEEQEKLSKYVGWGGLSEVFDESKEGQWKEARAFLKENLSSDTLILFIHRA